MFVVPMVLVGASLLAPPFNQEEPMTVLVDFSHAGSGPWAIVNDDVMGGLSSSQVEVTEAGTFLFTGSVSLENNGGFASTRTRTDDLDLSRHDGVVLRVRGDGRRYQFRLRTSGSSRGVAYRAEFETRAGEWQEVYLPFDSFRASFRGRFPRGEGPLDPARIRQMGFLIADKVEGPFRLEVAWIKAGRVG